MSFVFRHFWAIAVVTTVINGGLWWYRGRDHCDRDPSLADGYRSLATGFVALMSIPWFVMGAGQIFGGIPTPFAFLDFSSRDPFVLAFFLSIVTVWSVVGYWLFARDGAEKLVRHPGLFNRDPTNPKLLKLYFALGIGGTIVSIAILLWLGVPPR